MPFKNDTIGEDMPKIFDTENAVRDTELEIKAKSADVQFLSGALRAAKYASPKIRQKVLSEITDRLDCSAEELAFMFDGAKNDNSDNRAYDFPDSERRRKFIRDNFLDAAE